MVSGYPDWTLPVVHVGTITVEGTVAISGTVTVTGAVTVSGTVSVSGTVTVTGSVTVSGTVAVSGTVTVTGSVTVSGTVSISGSVTVTGSVTVSGAVTVATVAADNIIIDKLTVGAYTERRSTLSNDENPTAPNAPTYTFTGLHDRGKFFSRGCRGWIEQLQVYCKRTGSGTLTLGYRPNLTGGELDSVTVTPGADWAWVGANVRKIWQYDTLFVYVKACSADVSAGYDVGTPPDFYWTDADDQADGYYAARIHVRAVMGGETPGDIPVSGTINTIEIPHVGSSSYRGIVSVANGATETLLTIDEPGKNIYASFYCSHDAMDFIIETDGSDFLIGGGPDWLQPEAMQSIGYDKTSEGIQLIRYTADGACDIRVEIPFEWKRRLRIRCYNHSGAGKTAACSIDYNKPG